MGIQTIDLTPELRKRLDGFLPIPVTGTFDYTPRAFRDLPREQWPKFHLKYLDGATVMRSQDMLYGRVVSNGGDAPELVVKRGEFVVYVCEKGIAGWDGYFGLEYKDKGSIGLLPPSLLEELSNAITERKTLESEEQLGLK